MRAVPVVRKQKQSTEQLGVPERPQVTTTDLRQTTRASPIPAHVARDLFRPPPSHAPFNFGGDVKNATESIIRPQARHSEFHVMSSSPHSEEASAREQSTISQSFDTMFRSSPIPKVLQSSGGGKEIEEALVAAQKRLKALEETNSKREQSYKLLEERDKELQREDAAKTAAAEAELRSISALDKRGRDYERKVVLKPISQCTNWSVKKGIWEAASYQMVFLDWLAKQLNFTKIEDWYTVTKAIIVQYGGTALLAKYGNSPSRVIMSIYSDHKFLIWKFKQVPRGYWNDLSNQRAYFDWLGLQLGFKHLNDWYSITRDTVYLYGGSGLIILYRGSVIRALAAVYPEHKWLAWRFSQVPKGYWDSRDNQKQLLDWLAPKVHIRGLNDWYRISIEEVARWAPKTAFYKFGFIRMMKDAYPNHYWDTDKFLDRSKAMKASQRTLVEVVKEIFCNSEILEDHLHSELKFSNGRKMQLDVFLPKESLALEYQGQQHYFDAYNIGPQWAYQQRDAEKRIACNQIGITLVEVPYWWDRTKDSLAATIHYHREDLIPTITHQD